MNMIVPSLRICIFDAIFNINNNVNDNSIHTVANYNIDFSGANMVLLMNKFLRMAI